MANIIADLRQRQHDLKAEATALLDMADKDAEGVLSVEQDTRFKAIEAEIAEAEVGIRSAEIEAAHESALAEGRMQGLAHCKEVLGICAVADMKAADVIPLIEGGKSADDVRKQIVDDRARNAGQEISTRNTNTAHDKPASWDKAVDKVNARVKK